MSFFYLRTSIIKAGSGKSAVASASYQSATPLHDEALGKKFQYNNKEEVVFSQVMLPEYAPREFKDREVLWNEVQRFENKGQKNSRYARQFIVALPNSWSREECIEHSREFIQTALVDKGMIADWAFHAKNEDDPNKKNYHIHIQCTVRGFNPDGTWAMKARKEYAKTADGNRIPEIDPATGEQKIRMKKKNGKLYPEKIWKRVEVPLQSSEWNKRQFLQEVKKQWAETCNKYLPPEEHISHLSYEQRGINRVPYIHEALGSRDAFDRGVVFQSVRENQERMELNKKLADMEKFIIKAKEQLQDLKDRLHKKEKQDEEIRSDRAVESVRRNESITGRLQPIADGSHAGIGKDTEIQRIKLEAKELEKRRKKIGRRRR